MAQPTNPTIMNEEVKKLINDAAVAKYGGFAMDKTVLENKDSGQNSNAFIAGANHALTDPAILSAAGLSRNAPKQEAIEFAEWAGLNYVRLHEVWCPRHMSQIESDNWITSDQLYQLFLNNKTIGK